MTIGSVLTVVGGLLGFFLVLVVGFPLLGKLAEVIWDWMEQRFGIRIP